VGSGGVSKGGEGRGGRRRGGGGVWTIQRWHRVREGAPHIGDGVGARDSNPGFVGGEEKAIGVAKMFTAGWVSGRRPRTGRRAQAWALSAAGLLAALDRGGLPRLGGGRSLLGWRGPAAVCVVVSLSIATQGHVDEGWHDDSVIIVVRCRQQRLQGRDVR
jgi:hypothetical protein